MYAPIPRMYMHIYIHNYIYKYTHYSCMHQFRKWMGRYMKYATGRKRVMHPGMKQTCLPHSKNTRYIHSCTQSRAHTRACASTGCLELSKKPYLPKDEEWKSTS